MQRTHHSHHHQVTVTSAKGTNTALTPCMVALDGNEFYVYASMAIYERHDEHVAIRTRVWDTFCINVFGVRATHVSDDTPILESARAQECLVEWLTLVSPTPAATASTIDLATLQQVLVNTVRNNVMEQFPPPALCLACSLLAQCFGIGVVIYDVESPAAAAAASTASQWAPSRIWSPPEGVSRKYIHFLQRGHILEMLLHSQRCASPLSKSYPIPTRVVGSLPLQMKDRALSTQWDSELVSKHGVYSLDAYDAVTRTNIFIAHFIAPSTRIHPLARTIHYLRIDARINKSDMNFFIGGCTKRPEPVYIYASFRRHGARVAVLITHWAVDYYCPQICLEDTDECIIIVPCNDSRRAAQILTLEYQCQLYDRRPVEGISVVK